MLRPAYTLENDVFRKLDEYLKRNQVSGDIGHCSVMHASFLWCSPNPFSLPPSR